MKIPSDLLAFKINRKRLGRFKCTRNWCICLHLFLLASAASSYLLPHHIMTVEVCCCLWKTNAGSVILVASSLYWTTSSFILGMGTSSESHCRWVSGHLLRLMFSSIDFSRKLAIYPFPLTHIDLILLLLFVSYGRNGSRKLSVNNINIGRLMIVRKNI